MRLYAKNEIRGWYVSACRAVQRILIWSWIFITQMQAQTISGRVIDQFGDPVGDALVSIDRIGRMDTTDAQGLFAIYEYPVMSRVVDCTARQPKLTVTRSGHHHILVQSS